MLVSFRHVFVVRLVVTILNDFMCLFFDEWVVTLVYGLTVHVCMCLCVIECDGSAGGQGADSMGSEICCPVC